MNKVKNTILIIGIAVGLLLFHWILYDNPLINISSEKQVVDQFNNNIFKTCSYQDKDLVIKEIDLMAFEIDEKVKKLSVERKLFDYNPDQDHVVDQKIIQLKINRKLLLKQRGKIETADKYHWPQIKNQLYVLIQKIRKELLNISIS